MASGSDTVRQVCLMRIEGAATIRLTAFAEPEALTEPGTQVATQGHVWTVEAAYSTQSKKYIVWWLKLKRAG